jgi:DNA-3-methyladenine glycosylase II
MRGVAAHLWWSYYRVLKRREGVIGNQPKADAVVNKIPVAKRLSAKAKAVTATVPKSRT